MSLLQYGINLPFRFTMIGQTDSRNTHSIVRCWLGRKIQYYKYVNGKLTHAYLQHCCIVVMGTFQKMKKTNLGMNSSKTMTKDFFTLHMFQLGKNYSHLLPKHLTLMTKKNHNDEKSSHHTMDDSDIVSSESIETASNRVIVLDDLMNDAF